MCAKLQVPKDSWTHALGLHLPQGNLLYSTAQFLQIDYKAMAERYYVIGWMCVVCACSS